MIPFLITLLTFVAMEGVAWLAHKYLMHGWLWVLHEDHHQKNPRAVLEKNDNFFLIFACPGILMLALGTFKPDMHLLFFSGLGITIYGFAYFMVHDVFIHQRIKWFTKTDNWYFRAIRRAHKMHHKHLYKEDGECFGMLWVPLKYFKEAKAK
jgi:beta-carotene 3-hydroxylase